MRDRSRMIQLMNQLPMSKRVAVVSALVEGNSLRSTCRMTGVAMNTVLKLLAELGAACAEFHDDYVRDIHAKRIQCDDLAILLRQGKERPAGEEGHLRLR